MQNKRRLFIVGAGDLGREMESWLDLIPEGQRDWKLMGFLSDDEEVLKSFPTDLSILGKIEEYPLYKKDYVILAIANVQSKKNVFKLLKDKVSFFTFVAPTAIIGKFSKIGQGSIIFPGAIISNNVVLGDFVNIGCGTQIGHDSIIMGFSSLMANVDVGGTCVIGEGVFLGTNCTCLPRIKIESGSYIGSGAIVTRKITRSGTYFGNPAVKLE